MTTNEVTNKLYSEMAEYSILTKYLGKDEIEEININGWDDVAITIPMATLKKPKNIFTTAARNRHRKTTASPQRHDYR